MHHENQSTEVQSCVPKRERLSGCPGLESIIKSVRDFLWFQSRFCVLRTISASTAGGGGSLFSSILRLMISRWGKMEGTQWMEYCTNQRCSDLGTCFPVKATRLDAATVPKVPPCSSGRTPGRMSFGHQRIGSTLWDSPLHITSRWIRESACEV